MGLAYDFDWSVLWRHPYGMWLVKGLGLTIGIGIIAWIIALALGIAIGALRVTNSRILRFIGALYVETLRNIPLLVQMFFWFYAGPMLFGETLGRQINRISGLNVYVAIFGLGLYTASRVAEHMRGRVCVHWSRPIPGGAIHRHDLRCRCTVMSSSHTRCA